VLIATFLFQPHYGNDAYQFASTKTGRSSPGFYNNKQPIEWTNIIPTIDNPQPSSQYRYLFFHELLERPIYRKVASSRHLRTFRLFMQGKFDAYVLYVPLVKRVQN
jgi:hypothetical protein